MSADLRRRRRARLLTLAASTLLALAAGEVALRLFWGGYYVHAGSLRCQPNAVLGWENAPGSSFVLQRAEYRVEVHHERHGFRTAGGDVPERKPEGRMRVACLGDSFAWGFGVGDAETYAARLEAREPRIEAIDMGVSGYGPHQELAALRRYALPLAPDTVVWQVFGGNDIENLHALDVGYGVDAAGALVEGLPVASHAMPGDLYQRGPIDGPIAAVAQRSYLFRATADLAKSLTARAVGRTFTPREITPAQREEGWRLFRALLRAGAADCRSRGVRLLVVVVPMRDEVYRFAEPLAGARDFRERTPRICAEEGIAVLDLAAPLVAAKEAGGDLLYHRVDGHLTARGHDVAAAAILEEMRRLGWAPPAAPAR